MAIFSNLNGTMQSSFLIGKRGVSLVYENGILKIMDYTNTTYIPVDVGTPTLSDHAVSLKYFNEHGGDGLQNLKGTTIPLDSLGVDGQTYYQVNTTSIIKIYFKDSGVWKSI